METPIVAPSWKDLYKMAGLAAIVSEIVILLGIITYFIWPYAPGVKSAESIFQLLQTDPFGGLVSLDLFLFVGNLFSIFLFLALYVSLKPVNESYALIALVVGLIGVVLLIPSRPLVEMLSLSGRYATATSAVQKSQYLATGEAMLAVFNGTGWFMNTLLGAISLLASSILMLRSNIYSKVTAYVGIVTNAVVCGFFIPGLGNLLLFLSLLGYMIWYFQLARRFLQMAKEV
jgi:Domain of unknown function (DUF4386)